MAQPPRKEHDKVTPGGFFTMDDVKAIEKLTLGAAKVYAAKCVEAKKTAKPENVHKVMLMINRANSVTKLMFGMSNYVLSHDYNQGVVK